MKPPSDELLFCQMHRRARVGVGRAARATPFAAEGTTDGEHARNEEDRDDANADDDGGGEELIWGTAAPTRRDGRWRKRGSASTGATSSELTWAAERGETSAQGVGAGVGEGVGAGVGENVSTQTDATVTSLMPSRRRPAKLMMFAWSVAPSSLTTRAVTCARTLSTSSAMSAAVT